VFFSLLYAQRKRWVAVLFFIRLTEHLDIYAVWKVKDQVDAKFL